MRHALKNHGNAKYESERGQIPITDAEIAQIPEIVSNPDAYILGAKSKIGRDLIGYVKVLGDGTTLYIEENRTGKNRLAMVSIRKYPAAKNASEAIQTVLLNVRDDSGNVRIVYPDSHDGQLQFSRSLDSALKSAANNVRTRARMVVIDQAANESGMTGQQSKETFQNSAIQGNSIAIPAAKWLADTVIANEVEDRISHFAHQPPVKIMDTAFGVLPGATRDSDISGAVHGGVICLFRDQLGTTDDVKRTLFHELPNS